MTHKDLRKQLKNVLVEILPSTLTDMQFEMLNKKIDERLKKIEDDTKAIMTEMNERHRSTMGYLIRQVSQPDKK